MLKKITWPDLLVAILFALFALAFQLQRWSSSYNGIFINGDAALYTAVAAARSNPHLFSGDALLENPGNYEFYRPLHIPIIQALGWLTGDYGKGLVLLLGPLVWVHLLGYYILGRVLYQNRFWALILSITTAVYILTPIGDDVGLMFDPLPGFAFGALLPYLLSVIIKFQADTKTWIIIIACCAALIYVHPISAPAWVFGVWLCFALSNPDSSPLSYRLRRLVVLGLVVCCVALPFAALYLRTHDHVPDDVFKATAIRNAIEARVEPTLFSPGPTIANYAKWLLTDFPYTYFALLSLPFILLRNKTNKRNAAVLITATFGVVLFTVLIPCAESVITRGSGVPFQTDLIRPLKYVVPIIFIFTVWVLSAARTPLDRWLKSKYLPSFISVLIGLSFVMYVHRENPAIAHFVYPTFLAWLRGDPLAAQPTTQLIHLDAIKAVREFTPEKSKIFVASDFPLQIRYAALRPVVYAFKDAWFFTMSNYNALLKWHETYKKLGDISKTGYSAREVREMLLPTARDLNADYMLVYFGESSVRITSSRNHQDKVTPKKDPMTPNALLYKVGQNIGQRRHEFELDGLSYIWSNGQYGLFRLVR